MEIYTVSLFGHRQILNLYDAQNALVERAKSLIISKEYVEFLVGRNGDFDIMAASEIKRAQKALNYGNTCSGFAAYD